MNDQAKSEFVVAAGHAVRVQSDGYYLAQPSFTRPLQESEWRGPYKNLTALGRAIGRLVAKDAANTIVRLEITPSA